MIKISQIDNKLVKKYLDNQIKSFEKTIIEIKDIDKYKKVFEYLSVDGIICKKKIEKIIVGDINELKNAISFIGEVIETKSKGFHKLYDNFTSRNLGKEWAELINVNICPYCNRNYIFSLKKSGIRPQYDHFFPISLFPYLSVSMYNLIPCCPICNLAKTNYDNYDKKTKMEKLIYPFEDEYGHEINFRTKYDGDFTSWLGASLEFKLELEPLPDAKEYLIHKSDKTRKQLHIDDLYEKHKDFVKEIILKTYIYNKKYFDGLMKSFPELFKNKEDVMNFVYMNYLEKENWDKRILSKLTYDIVREFSI